jgi:hypothetical protein
MICQFNVFMMASKGCDFAKRAPPLSKVDVLEIVILRNVNTIQGAVIFGKIHGAGIFGTIHGAGIFGPLTITTFRQPCTLLVVFACVETETAPHRR